MNLASIDIGTNSCRLLIVKKEKGDLVPLLKKNYVTRLGEGLIKNNLILEKAIDRTLSVLKEFKKDLEKYKTSKYICACTEAVRRAKNKDIFLEKVKKLGFNIQILPDYLEAKLIYFVNLKEFKKDKLLTIDLGGGSTEVVFGRKDNIEFLKSLKIGIVTLYEKFIDKNLEKIGKVYEERKDVKNLENFLREFLKEVLPKKNLKDYFAVSVGGTITSIVAMKLRLKAYKEELISGQKVTYKDLVYFCRFLSQKSLEERKKILGLHPKRADVILPGICFYKVFCEVSNINCITASEKSLLWGLIYYLHSTFSPKFYPQLSQL